MNKQQLREEIFKIITRDYVNVDKNIMTNSAKEKVDTLTDLFFDKAKEMVADKDDVMRTLYQRNFRERLREKMVKSAIFGNEDEYLCRMILPTENHKTQDEATKQIKDKPYVPYLATLVKTFSSFFLSSMTDFIVDEVIDALTQSNILKNKGE